MGSSTSKSFSPNKLGAKAANCNIKNSAKVSKKMSDNDYVEAIVCNENDIKENEMKVFDVGESGRVLLVKQNGQFSALGTKCTHYGAPLVTGALGDGRLRCPWHGACFNIKTGDIEDFPGFDSLPCYQVTVEDEGKVKVRAKRSDLEANRRVKTLGSPLKSCDGQTFVVVGGGPSAAVCAETLRQEGFKGRLVMIAKENCLPYDRIKVSKLGADSKVEKLQFRHEDYYKENRIEVFKGTEAIKVDTANKKVELSDGKIIDFTSLYLATGSKPRVASIPGIELVNSFTVRDLTDTNAILAAIGDNKDKEVVVLGLSFIGLEIASSCVDKAKKVTIVGKDKVPLENIFGFEIGDSLRKLFESKGVSFSFQNTVTACNGDKKVESVQLSNGSIIPADVFITGIGTTFYTDFLKDSGIEMQPNGAIPVNERLETNVQGIYAGGDIAHAPVFAHYNKKASIGHIGLAQYHGKIAAYNMLDKDVTLKTVPFFWTMLFNKSIRYAGYGKHSSVLIDGNVDELKFVMFFFDETERVIAVASCMRDPIVAQFAELLAQGKSLHKDDLKDDHFAWVNEIHS